MQHKEGHGSAEHNYESPYRALSKIEPDTILHVPTGTELTKEQFIKYLAHSRVVYVGEEHTNLGHHSIQLEVIKRLEEQNPGNIAIGMEMFQRPAQSIIDAWIRGELSDQSFFMEWIVNWNIDYDYYRGILEFAREKKIPVIALNVSREELKALNSHKGMEGGGKPPEPLVELDESDPYHKATMMAVFTDSNHKAGQPGNFYMIQLLWEETMAETIADYLKSDAGEGKQMVVVAGGGHIGFGFGIPKRVFRRLAEPFTTVMPVSAELMGDKKKAMEKGAKFLDVDLPMVPLHISDFVWGVRYRTLEGKKPKMGIHLKEGPDGVVIGSVVKGSIAQNGGLEEGDIIAVFEGEIVTEVEEIIYLMSSKKFGENVRMSIRRGEESMEVTLDLERLKKGWGD